MDRLETAKGVIVAVLLFSILVFSALLADSTIRSGYSPDMRLKGAQLAVPALYPSGHPLRNPEGGAAAVDLRFTPGLPLHLKDPLQTAAAPAEKTDGVYQP